MKAFGVKKSKKLRTSLRLPGAALEQISSSMILGKYGDRERSKWICEAVAMLFSIESYWELIAEGFMDEGDNQLIPLTIDGDTCERLDEIEKQFREVYPGSVIDMSMIIRSAIYYRLISEGGGIA